MNFIPLHVCVPLGVDSEQKNCNFVTLRLKPEMWQNVKMFQCCVFVLQPPESEPEEDFEDEIKTPEPKEWISLGSEKEIDEESVKETRAKVLQNTLNN